MTGCSCRTGAGSTAFVATTANEQFAKNWGRDRIVIQPQATARYYVYKIRATGNFYDAAESLHEAYRATGDRNYLTDADHYGYQQEWLAYGGIPAEQVEQATAYGRPDRGGNVPRFNTVHNRNYIDANTRGNPAPFQQLSTFWCLWSSLRECFRYRLASLIAEA